jgi:peptide/nickel transport system substrate-binding protein
MRTPIGHRFLRLLAGLGLVAALVLPAAAAPGVAAAEKLVLRVGTTQDLSSMNPWNAYLVIDYEAFQLNYDLLVGFGNDLQPVPGFAESWQQSATDPLTWTFKIRPGMKWSDGKPATSEDARYTIQFVLDGDKAGDAIGYTYISAYITNSGIDSVSAPDPETLVVHTKYATDKVLSMDAPILPKHVWEKYTPKNVGDFPNDVPVVGTGPYQAVEWKTGQFARFARNPYYWGSKGAADEVVLRFFPDAQETMVEAFKAGEVDYIRNPSGQQFDQLKALPNTVAINAESTGFSELAFNCWTKPVPGGGASTTAVADPSFRDALGYAVDTQVILDKALHGYGAVGTTFVPPFYTKYHVEPANPRTFDIELAKQKLLAAGYALDADGNRLDKENKPISLRLYWPTSTAEYATYAQFITDWFGQLGIKVKGSALDDDTLAEYLIGPTEETPVPKGKLAYDMFLWGWVGDTGDPNTLLQIFQTSEIGGMSDSQYSNPRYDELYTQQNEAPDAAARQGPMAEMQQIIYGDAPYIVTDYGSELHVYHTDKFGNWQTMPTQGGTPFFVMGTLNYATLTVAGAEPSPSPAASASPGSSAAPSTAAPSAAPSASPEPSPSGGAGTDNSLLLLGGAVILVAVLAVGFVAWRRRAAATGGGEEE